MFSVCMCVNLNSNYKMASSLCRELTSVIFNVDLHIALHDVENFKFRNLEVVYFVCIYFLIS